MQNVKASLLSLAIADIEEQIAAAERGRKDAIEESKAHKGAMASRYDTFKEEAQYLAGGFAARIQELSSQLAALKSLQMRLAANSKVSGGAIVEVSIAGLGIFSVKKRAARTARNPRTGATVNVPAMNVPKFRAAKALKDSVK